jgi:FixJ family two-component response regulator
MRDRNLRACPHSDQPTVAISLAPARIADSARFGSSERWKSGLPEPLETDVKREEKVIVVVEDDPGMRGSLEFLLESHGFTVAAFAGADEMLSRLNGLKTGCAIFDVHLPGPDGISVYESMKAQGRKLPAIFITGRADDQIRANARRLKAVALLEKPFSDEALLDAVGRAFAMPVKA